MPVGWQKLRVPIMERLSLLDMAMRRNESEEETLARIIREAVWRECARLAAEEQGQQVKGQEAACQRDVR